MTANPTWNCEHATRAARTEAPVIAEMAAAIAHLDKAADADPQHGAAHYASRGQENQLPTWVRANADRIRATLDALVNRYTDPAA